jgi:hypothetical protein
MVKINDFRIPYTPHLKYMPVVWCVSAAGESVKLFIVSLLVHDSFMEELKIQGPRLYAPAYGQGPM